MEQIFHRINGMASLTCMQYEAERALPHAKGQDAEYLRRIIETNVPDEAYAICSEALGDPETAVHILSQRAARKARDKEFDAEWNAMCAA